MLLVLCSKGGIIDTLTPTKSLKLSLLKYEHKRFSHEAAYLNAKKEYDVCLEHGNLGQMANVAATVAEELKEMGLFHEAKRALEPALRFLRLSNLENHAAIELYANLKLKVIRCVFRLGHTVTLEGRAQDSLQRSAKDGRDGLLRGRLQRRDSSQSSTGLHQRHG